MLILILSLNALPYHESSPGILDVHPCNLPPSRLPQKAGIFLYI
jgi:hypothetical protein